VSADTALLFEALTGWDAQIWLTLQAKWDLCATGVASSKNTAASLRIDSVNAAVAWSDNGNCPVRGPTGRSVAANQTVHNFT
jgi:hypothetical protein